MPMIGSNRCPVCSFTGARILETKAKKAMLYCDACEVQIFARGAKSDKRLREGMTAEADEPAAPAPAAPAAPAAPKPAAAKPKPKPATAPAVDDEGVLL